MDDVHNHDEIRSLLGAFALDATDPDETVTVDGHLESCAACRAEVDALREVAGLLGTGDVPPPEHLWDRIAAELGEEPPAMVLPLRAAEHSRHDRRTDRRAIRLAVAAVVLLICGITALGFVSVSQQRQIDKADRQLTSIREGSSLGTAAAHAATRPGARQIALRSTEGTIELSAIIERDGNTYIVPSESLSRLDAKHTYQLWGITGSQAISLGLLGSEPGVVRLKVPNGMDALAVTVEAAPGVVTSKNQPVAQATI